MLEPDNLSVAHRAQMCGGPCVLKVFASVGFVVFQVQQLQFCLYEARVDGLQQRSQISRRTHIPTISNIISTVPIAMVDADSTLAERSK